MNLTPAQIQTLSNDIEADPVLSAVPDGSDGNATIAAAYNNLASPVAWVFKTRMTLKEVTEITSIDADGTTPRTFNWTLTGFITRAQGERDAWFALWGQDDQCNPSLANVRQAFVDIFSGATAPAPSNRTHLQNTARRRATRAERLFATGTGTPAAPATMTFEGPLDPGDVEMARELP